MRTLHASGGLGGAGRQKFTQYRQVCFQGQGELPKSKRGAPGTQRLNNNNNTERDFESFPKSLKKKEEEKKKERKKERPQGENI